jgi:hypothetical protein
MTGRCGPNHFLFMLLISPPHQVPVNGNCLSLRYLFISGKSQNSQMWGVEKMCPILMQIFCRQSETKHNTYWCALWWWRRETIHYSSYFHPKYCSTVCKMTALWSTDSAVQLCTMVMVKDTHMVEKRSSPPHFQCFYCSFLLFWKGGVEELGVFHWNTHNSSTLMTWRNVFDFYEPDTKRLVSITDWALIVQESDDNISSFLPSVDARLHVHTSLKLTCCQIIWHFLE